MGFRVTNDTFAANAWYFRNALVRANYNNWNQGIRETTSFLELFMRNLLLGEKNELKNRYLHIRWNESKQDIEDTKQDIQTPKQDIQPLKQDIELPAEINPRTKQNIYRLFEAFGYDRFFGRTQVMEVLGITASPASALLSKMSSLRLIMPMEGRGKGKYFFVKEQ